MGEVLQLSQGDRPGDQIREVFDYWREVMGHERSRLDAGRSRTVRAMLEAGYSVDDLKLAIDGCAGSEWHRGKNDRATVYDGLGLICRDAEHVDRFMQLGEALHRRVRARLEERAKAAEPRSPKRPMPEDVRAKVRAYLTQKTRTQTDK